MTRPAVGSGRNGALSILGVFPAIALAAFAEHIIDHPFHTGLPLIGSLNRHIEAVYQRPESVLPAALLFVLAGIVFVRSLRGRAEETPEADDSSEPELPAAWSRFAAFFRYTRAGRMVLPFAVAGVAMWVYLVVDLWRGGYEHYYPGMFALSLLLMAAPFVLFDLRDRGLKAVRVSAWEVGIVAAICAVTFWLNVRDLDGWRYSFIGDEGAFFNVAKEIDQGKVWNFFSQRGVYGYHPVADSFNQALVMKAFGVNYFGWKMASLLAVVLTLPPFYVVVRLLFGRLEAVVAAVILGASQYLMAYAHTGYNNIFALLPTTLAFAFLAIGWRTRSVAALVLSGMAAGMGFYTFFSARAAIVILALFVLSLGPRYWRPLFVGPIAAGFAVAVLPIFAVNKLFVIKVMLDSSATEAQGGLVEHLLHNVPGALFAFNFNTSTAHYLSGPLLDPVSGVAAVLGLAYALSRIRLPGYRFAVIWYVVALVVTGLFNKVGVVAETRMHIVLLVMALFGGIAVSRVVGVVAALSHVGRVDALIKVGAVAALGLAVLAINVHQFRVVSAKASGTSNFTAAVRAVTEGPCSEYGHLNTIVAVTVETFGMNYVLNIYNREERPLVVDYDSLAGAPYLGKGCLVLIDQGKPEAAALKARLEGLVPGLKVRTVTDLSGGSRVWVIDPLP